jgi:tetratricopeptide (TPR) repeat protein
VLFGAAAALRLHPVYSERLIPDLAANALYGNALTQIDAVVFLGSRLIFPYPLNIDPDLRAVTAWSPLLAAKAILLLASLWIGIAALRKTGRRPWWGFAIFWFYLQLAPTNSLLPRLDVANDRQLYLASFGACVAVAAEAALLRASLSSARAWTQQAFAAALAVVAALFLGLTIARNQDYRAEISLWEQTARWSPAKPRVRNNLGYAYSAAGCIDKAQAQYREALRLDPAYRIARDNLAIVSMRSSSESTCAMAAARRP